MLLLLAACHTATEQDRDTSPPADTAPGDTDTTPAWTSGDGDWIFTGDEAGVVTDCAAGVYWIDRYTASASVNGDGSLVWAGEAVLRVDGSADEYPSDTSFDCTTDDLAFTCDGFEGLFAQDWTTGTATFTLALSGDGTCHSATPMTGVRAEAGDG